MGTNGIVVMPDATNIFDLTDIIREPFVEDVKQLFKRGELLQEWGKFNGLWVNSQILGIQFDDANVDYDLRRTMLRFTTPSGSRDMALDVAKAPRVAFLQVLMGKDEKPVALYVAQSQSTLKPWYNRVERIYTPSSYSLSNPKISQ